MKIPSDIAIKSVLKPGSVFYFIEDSFQSKEPHYFVVLNKDPITENLLLMVNATSNVSDRISWAKKVGLPAATLVEADSRKCTFLAKQSIFNCNSPIIRPLKTLIEKFDDSKLGLKGNVTDEVLEELRQGVILSPLVDGVTKEMIKYRANIQRTRY